MNYDIIMLLLLMKNDSERRRSVSLTAYLIKYII